MCKKDGDVGGNVNGEATPDKPQLSVIYKILQVAVIACCILYVFCGIWGAVRGYSLQSYVPIFILISGLFLVLPLIGHQYKVYFLIWFIFICYFVCDFQQGKYYDRGEKLFKDGKYLEALSEYEKELNTWYLRFHYNDREATSMYKMAECYGQLERYDDARKTYQLMRDRLKGYYQTRSVNDLAKLEEGLRKVKLLREQLAREPDPNKKVFIFYDLALAYRYNLNCKRKALEQYQAIVALGLDLPEIRKELAKKQIQELQ
ncbi:MAG: tetratricopeptide repeat protein [Planctomycetota bacterium]|jgi:tetratricopeptide (TPR) repeat protein